MKKYNSFIFDSIALDQREGRIEMRYSLDEKEFFLEQINLPFGFEFMPVSLALLDRAFFALHLIGGISYYKTCCPPSIEVRSGTLSKEQAGFWNEVYEKGLMEFFFENNINPGGLINFPPREHAALLEMERPKIESKILVPLGGGKDSVVTAEILKNAGWDVTLLRVGSNPLIEELARSMELPLMSMERTLSPRLFELNKEGAMNGHIPITAYISFVGISAALMYGFDMVAMSNEKSADEGSLEKWGKKINHQWSKSWEFEKLLIDYVKNFITKDVRYFSLLRHLSELSITKYFCTMPKYFNLITSCNRNWRIENSAMHHSPASADSGAWCCECPKCASSFAMFSAFLPKETLLGMFGKNMFDDQSLELLYKELLGVEGVKPFDCVGTIDEIRSAFLLAHEKGDFDSSRIMQMFLKEVSPKIKDPSETIRKSLEPGSVHAIPDEFLTAIHET